MVLVATDKSNDVNGRVHLVDMAASGRGCSGATQVVNKRNPQHDSSVRIATWNVRSMMRVGKLENIKREMERGQISILDLCET
jgi:hypothetical protein